MIDSTGKITGYKTKAGADTVFPFSSVTYLLKNGEIASDDLKSITVTSGNYSLVEDNIGKNLLVDTYGKTLCFKIDLTNYKKLVLACRCNGANNQFNAGVYSSPTDCNTGYSGSCLDVSSYTGEYYVCTNYAHYIRVYDILGF